MSRHRLTPAVKRAAVRGSHYRKENITRRRSKRLLFKELQHYFFISLIAKKDLDTLEKQSQAIRKDFWLAREEFIHTADCFSNTATFARHLYTDEYLEFIAENRYYYHVVFPIKQEV